MRVVLLSVAILTLSACDEPKRTITTTTTMDANMMNGATTDSNMAVDPATQNMIQQDMNTNTPDTNLANGM